MSKTRYNILGVAVLGIAILGLSLYERSESSSYSRSVTAQTQAGVAAEPAVAQNEPKASKPSEEFSLETSSLRGTEVDGGVLLDANGQVVLDIGMRRLFDYYLSLVGERDIIQIRRLLEDYLLAKHNQITTEKVLQYFDLYTDYLNALSSLNVAALLDPTERFEKVTALRNQMLGARMSLAFFGEEEALAALTLKRMAIANDKSLSVDEKSRLLAELDNSANYTARTEADTPALISEQNRQLDALKLTNAQRVAEREALWGKAAAARLALLDQQRAQWEARLAHYLQARSHIDANRRLSDSARDRAIASLRAQQFNAAEQRRIASLEAIGELKPGG